VDRPHGADLRVTHLPPPRALPGFPSPEVPRGDIDGRLGREAGFLARGDREGVLGVETEGERKAEKQHSPVKLT